VVVGYVRSQTRGVERWAKKTEHVPWLGFGLAVELQEVEGVLCGPQPPPVLKFLKIEDGMEG